MKNIKFKKVLIFSFICILLISAMTISCFADVGEGFVTSGDVISLNEVIHTNFFPSNELFINFYVLDEVGTIYSFDRISLSYRGYPVISYGDSNGYVEVYTGAWSDLRYQTIYVSSNEVLPSDWNAFLSLNSHSSPTNFYSEIYDVLKGAIYGDLDITSDMNLSLSLVSTILSMLVVLAPVLVGGFIFVWILKRF